MAPKLPGLYLGRSGVKSRQAGKDLPRLGSSLLEPRGQADGAGAAGVVVFLRRWAGIYVVLRENSSGAVYGSRCEVSGSVTYRDAPDGWG